MGGAGTEKHNGQYVALRGERHVTRGCGSSGGTRITLDVEDWEGFPERGTGELDFEKLKFSSDTGAPQEAHLVYKQQSVDQQGRC